MLRLRKPLQFADIKVGDPAKILDVEGGQGRSRHQRRGRNKTVQGFDAVGARSCPDSWAMRESTSITVSVVSSASILATSTGVRCG